MSNGPLLHLFVGKGGVGKTTLATAYAMRLQEDAPKESVLLLTTTASLALTDLLKKKVTAKPTKLIAGKGEAGLFVAEMDPEAAFKGFVAKYKPALAAAAQKGNVMSAEDLGKILVQSLPGLEELAGLFQVMDLVEDKSFDRVVLDTAPTSHTLRQLDMPLLLKKVIALAKGEKLGAKKKEGVLPEGVLDETVVRADKLLAFLKDPQRTSIHLATHAEPVPEAQTRMYFAQLRERGFPITEILVNAIENDEGCQACQGRRGLQAPHVRKFQALDKNVPVNLLGRRELGPRGLDALKKLSKEWATGKETKALEFSAAEGPPALVRAPSMAPIAAPPLTPTRLIFFVGQGGVGKSSCAAAAAVTLTEKEGPVLLISTDPAHSLSDVLQSRLTDTETQVKGTKGLYARELDTQNWFHQLRKRLRERTDRAFEALPKNEVVYDRELLRGLLDTAPAGIEELAGMCVLTDALVQERFKRIVVDPTPTLQTLRLVELPEVARGWLGALLEIVTKYKTKGLADLAEDLAALIKHVKRFEAALASPTEARFVVVTRGEELATLKTERLVEDLQARKLNVERVLVNRVGPKSTCEKCENRRQQELLMAKSLEKNTGLAVTVAPALGRHPAGLRELKGFRTSWYALSATAAKIKAA